MANKIKFKICTPSDIYKEAEVDEVQVPAYEGDITLLPLRAPTVFILKMGFVRLMDSKNKGRYFIKSGVADYYEGICKVMAEEVIDYNNMDIKDYEALRNNSEIEEKKNYYQEIIDMLVLEKIREV